MHPHSSKLLHWSSARARVAVALASDRAAGGGGRRWLLRLSADAQRLDLPLNVLTPIGAEPLHQTRSAVLSAAGLLLQELGAVPTDAAGAPLLAALCEGEPDPADEKSPGPAAAESAERAG